MEEQENGRVSPEKDEDVEMKDEVKSEEEAAAGDSDSAREFKSTIQHPFCAPQLFYPNNHELHG